MPAPRPPGVTITLVAVDERRLADQPPDVAAAEILQDVALPDDGAVLHAQTGKVAVLGEHVEAIAVNGRRASWPGP